MVAILDLTNAVTSETLLTGPPHLNEAKDVFYIKTENIHAFMNSERSHDGKFLHITDRGYIFFKFQP
jgi:hypothetical protein